jgi:hypothetical protein
MSHEQAAQALREGITQNHALLRQCHAQDGAITEGATARLKQVLVHLDKLRKNVVTDSDAADEYLELTREKGALLRTLARG